MNTTTLVLLGLAFLVFGGGGGGVGKKQDDDDDVKCDPNTPVVYDGDPFFVELRASDAKAGMTNAERVAMRTIMTRLQSDEGLPQPVTGGCILESLEAKGALPTSGNRRTRWARVVALLTFAAASGQGGLNGVPWYSLGKAPDTAKLRVALLASRAVLHYSPEANTETEGLPAAVVADIDYILATRPKLSVDLPPSWAAAKHATPFHMKGGSDPEQTWQQWLTNLVYWKWNPNGPVQIVDIKSEAANLWLAIFKVLSDRYTPVAYS